jgi:serine/threonine-protein kinase
MGTDTDRYRILRVAGRGQRALVFAAEDTVLGRTVALKRAVDVAAGASLRAEAVRVARVHSPHVVAIHDLLDGDPVILVLEWLEGATLRTRLHAGRPRPADVALWVTQLLAGLEALHAAGVVHGDVKPENLWIGSDGGLKLLDIGAGGEATALYAAPEVGAGDPPTPAGDLYAAATVAWEMLAGRTPFDAADAAELAARKRTRAAPAVGTAGANAPLAVEAWLGRALAIAAAQRFATAADAGLAWRHAMAEAPGTAAPGQVVLHPAAAALLRNVAGAARARRGFTGLVTGLPGAGKSTLLATGAREARAEAVWVLEVRRAPTARRRFVDWHVAARRALRGHRDLPARALLVPIGTGGEIAVQDRVVAALAGLAQRQPVLVACDEPSSCDAATRRLVVRLAHEAAAAGFAVAVAADAVRRRRSAMATWSALADCATDCVELRDPDDEAFRAFVAARLGVVSVSDALVAHVRARTGGNPKLAVALLRGLRHAGALQRVDDAWLFRPERVQPGLPADATAVLERGVVGLPAAPGRLLVTAAVHGSEFDAAIVAAVAGSPAAAVEQSLHEIARERGVVRGDGAVWRFVPPLLAEALCERLAPATRAEMHRRFAAALQAGTTPDEAAIGTHLDRGGEPERALPHLERAAHAALERGDARAAIDCATRACRAADTQLDSEAAVRRRVELGLLRARGLHVLAAWDDAIGELETTIMLARAWGFEALAMRGLRAQGQVEYARHRYDDAVACYLAAQACAARASDDLELHELALQVGNIHFERGSLDAAATEYERALVWADAHGATELGARAANNVALVESLQGRKHQAVEYFNRSRERFVALGRDAAVARIEQNIGQIYLELHNWAEARNFFRRAVERSERTGEDALLAVSCLDFAEATLRLGSAAEAAPAVERALAISRERGDTVGVANAQRLQAQLAAAAGDVGAAETLLVDAIDKLAALGEALHLALSWKDLGAVRLQAGRHDAAREALAEAHQRFASLDAPQHAAEVEALRARCREESACRP